MPLPGCTDDPEDYGWGYGPLMRPAWVMDLEHNAFGFFYEESVIADCENIRRQALDESENIRMQALDDAARTKEGANIYAEQVLVNLEQNINQLQEIVKNGQLQLERRRSESDGQYISNYMN